MKISSRWTFDTEARHIWPNFLHATMDDSRPLLFRLGVPKPISCKILEGKDASVGRTRQCTTDRGTIDQRILVCDENLMLRYRMIRSTVWCEAWIGHLEDEFTLTSLADGATQVERRTEFRSAGRFRPLKQIALWLALSQAHIYAARNWRRLARLRKQGSLEAMAGKDAA